MLCWALNLHCFLKWSLGLWNFVDKSFHILWVGLEHPLCAYKNNNFGRKLFVHKLHFSSLWVDVPPRAFAPGQIWMGEVWHNSYFRIWSLRRAFVLHFRFWMVIFWWCIFKDCGWEILSSHKNHSFCLNLPSALLYHVLHHWPCWAWFSFVHWL